MEHSGLVRQNLILSSVDNIPCSFLIVDKQGNVVYANNEANRTLGISSHAGLSADEWADQFKWYNPWNGKELETTDKPLFKALNNASVQCTLQIRHQRTGKDWLFTCNANPVLDNEELIGASLKLSPLELEPFKLIANQLSSSVVITDKTEKITWCNLAFEKHTGYSSKEYLGFKPSEFLQGNLTQASSRKKIREALLSEKPVTATIINYKKDGTPFWVSLHIAPIRDRFGEVRNFLSIQHDITESMEAKMAIDSSERELRLALEQLEYQKFALDQHSIVAVTDVKGTIIYCNDKFSEISKYSREELVGQNHRILNSGHQPKSFWKEMFQTVSSGKVWQREVLNRAKDGVEYWVDTTIVPYMNPVTNKPEKYIAIRTDISKRKQFEKRQQNMFEEMEATVKSRTAELQAAKEVIEKKNHDIIDSINYAQRIQQAILPSLSELKAIAPDGFVIFSPKDIVSGDFYWCHDDGENIIVAMVDCTGHGVPGALMSVAGHELLDSIVINRRVTRTDMILEEMDLGVRKLLGRQDAQYTLMDGMDMSVVRIHRSGKFEFSGAQSHGLYIKKDEIIPLIPSRKGIGGLSSNTKTEFGRQRIISGPGDRFYLFSDGFYDQFGGEEPKGKKMKRKHFTHLIVASSNRSMNEQSAFLERHFKRWKGEREQLDDVTVLGIQI